MANEIGQSGFTLMVTCTAADQKLDLVTSRNEITVVADGDCFINFDDEVTAGNRFLIKANTQYIFQRTMFRTMHYLAATGSPKLYVMAWKSASN